jgi:hypothetical protein
MPRCANADLRISPLELGLGFTAQQGAWYFGMAFVDFEMVFIHNDRYRKPYEEVTPQDVAKQIRSLYQIFARDETVVDLE